MIVMKKSVVFVVVGLIILGGMETVALPLNHTDPSGEQSQQASYLLPTNTTNLSIEIRGGIGVTAIFTNTGEFDAINVTTEIDNINEPFHFFSIGKGGLYIGPLSPGAAYKERIFPLGVGIITVNATGYAENAAPVTKTAKGIILLFFVIIK
jgi:hypothetical protein